MGVAVQHVSKIRSCNVNVSPGAERGPKPNILGGAGADAGDESMENPRKDISEVNQ